MAHISNYCVDTGIVDMLPLNWPSTNRRKQWKQCSEDIFIHQFRVFIYKHSGKNDRYWNLLVMYYTYQ
jgi:hypothetical protein